jgi:hypothetical protein
MNITVKNNRLILTESYMLNEKIAKQPTAQINKELSHIIAFLQEGFSDSVVCSKANILADSVNKDNVKAVNYLKMELEIEFPEGKYLTDHQLEEFGELFHAAKLGFIRAFLLY